MERRRYLRLGSGVLQAALHKLGEKKASTLEGDSIIQAKETQEAA
jgi:hypothetical protein